MSKLYVPEFNNSNCVYIRDSDTIRVYESVPQNGRTINYTDYFIRSNYISTNGSTTFNNYSTLPTCLSSSTITTDYWYRYDFDKILVILFIILILCFYFPYRIISRLFGRWLKW